MTSLCADYGSLEKKCGLDSPSQPVIFAGQSRRMTLTERVTLAGRDCRDHMQGPFRLFSGLTVDEYGTVVAKFPADWLFRRPFAAQKPECRTIDRWHRLITGRQDYGVAGPFPVQAKRYGRSNMK